MSARIFASVKKRSRSSLSEAFLEDLERPGHLQSFMPDLVHVGHAAFAHKLRDAVGAYLVAHLGMGD